MLLSEAIETLEKAGYEVEPLNEGKIGRVLGAAALALTSFANAYIPQNILNVKDDENFVSLTKEETPKELEGGYVKYNVQDNEYLKCKKIMSGYYCSIYDTDLNLTDFVSYDRQGKIVSVKRSDNGSEFSKTSSILKPNYEIKDFELGKNGFLIYTNSETGRTTEILVKDGKFIKSVSQDKTGNNEYTIWKNNEPVKTLKYYDNDDKTLRSEWDIKTGNYVEYYINGTVKVEGQFNKTGNKDGKWTVYFENGQPAQWMEYEDGELQGRVKCSDGRQGREGFDCRFDQGNSRFNNYYNAKQNWNHPSEDFPEDYESNTKLNKIMKKYK